MLGKKLISFIQLLFVYQVSGVNRIKLVEETNTLGSFGFEWSLEALHKDEPYLNIQCLSWTHYPMLHCTYIHLIHNQLVQLISIQFLFLLKLLLL